MCVDNIDPCVCIYACSSAETFLPSLKSPGRGDGGRTAETEGGRSEGHHQEQAGAFRHGGEHRVLVLRVGAAVFCVLLCAFSSLVAKAGFGMGLLSFFLAVFFYFMVLFQQQKAKSKLSPLPSPPHAHPHLYFIFFFTP